MSMDAVILEKLSQLERRVEVLEKLRMPEQKNPFAVSALVVQHVEVASYLDEYKKLKDRYNAAKYNVPDDT